jgi:PKD repeat protein
MQPINNQSGYKSTEVIIDVQDPDDDALTLSAESSDTNLIPQSNLFISGAGASWRLIITPAQTGNATITVYADDNNGNVISTSFDFQSYPMFKLPDNVTILPGTFSVPLTLNNPLNENIYSIEFTMDFDPQVINATHFQLTDTKLINNYLMEFNTGISGQVIVCIASNNEVYTGTGLIGLFDFETIAESQQTSLFFSNARLNEWNGLTQSSTVTVQSNQAPTISNIANVSIDEDTQTSVIFTVDDPETSPCSVTLDISTDNALLTPLASMYTTCINNTYTLVIDPAANKFGTANITITATDDYNASDTQSFAIEVASVNDDPQISPIGNQILDEDTTSNPISFNISDIETLASNLILSADASNTGLIPVDNIVFGGSDENRTIVITPSENQNGSATITINVTDSDTTVHTDFNVTVSSVDDSPVVQNTIHDVSVNENAANYMIDLSTVFTDIDNDDTAITKSIMHNNDSALVGTNISGNTLTLSFATNRYGTSDITILANSNGLTASDTFTVTVSEVDDPPVVISPIADVSVDEDAANYPIDISSVFTDPDNDDTAIVKTIQNNTNSGIVTPIINGNILTLSFIADQSGSANITIRGTSNGQIVDNTFTVTAAPVDDAPVVNTPVSDVEIDEDADTLNIDLSVVFTDIDNDDAAIEKTILNNSNSGLITATITNNVLSLSFAENQSGTGNITIRGTSNGKTVEDTFSVIVLSVDDPPHVLTPIEDVLLNEDAPVHVISLISVFTDIDNEDSHISKTVLSNTNTSLVNASISGNDLILTFTENQSGVSAIEIKATSNGQTVIDIFTVTIAAQDDPVQVNAPIEDINIDEDAGDMTIDLSSVFTDIDNDDNAIVKTIQSNSNPGLITASIVNNSLTLSFASNHSGNGSIIVRGNSNGKTVDDIFIVTVSPVDDPPHILFPIEDVTLNEDAPEYNISLLSVFTDIDNDDNQISKAVRSITNTSLINANINANDLVLSLQENQSGVASIEIEATSNGKTVIDIFTVTVNAIDDPVQVIVPIQDIAVDEDADNWHIDLSSVFTDIDNDDNAIVKTIQSNSNPELVDATLVNNSLTLDFVSNQSGTGSITIRGTSNGKTVDDTFTVTVSPVDDAPFVLTEINDVQVNEDDQDYTIPLENVFSDEDTLFIDKTIQSNSNESLVNASINNDLITLSFQENQNGTAIIEILANANGLTAVETFSVTVTAIDDAPEVTAPVEDVTVNEDADDLRIDLSSVFTDIDNDNAAITKIVQDNTNLSLVTTHLEGNALTLCFNANQNGSATITIQANSNGINITDVFEVIVKPVDDAPMVNLEIDNVVVNENAIATLIPLTNVFVDIDNDPIVHTIESNTNESLVDAIIVDKQLILQYQQNKSGEAIITLRGTANMLFDHISFIVTVFSVDFPPELRNPINDIVVDEGADNAIIPLTDVFTDPDNDDLTIQKSMIANTNETIVMASIMNNQLILDFLENMNGSASITIQGTSNGKSVTDTFDILVRPVDNAPHVKNPINDITVEEDSPRKTIPLSDVFTDIDNDDALIALSFNYTNETLLTVSMQEKDLHLTFLPNQYGTSVISIQATSNGLTVVERFMVQVISVNDLPEMFNLTDLMTYESLPVTQTVMATDADNRDLTLSYTVSDAELLPYNNITFVGGNGIDTNHVAIEKDIPVEIHVKPAFSKSGNVTITLKIFDGIGGTDEQSFVLTVKKYHITATATGNGKIVPSGVVEVNTNTPEITFQLQPENGHVIDSLIVDDKTISARPTYSFRNVSEYHTITAIFREPVVYTISTHLDDGGSIDPEGMIQVIEGHTQKFQIQSKLGFEIDYLMVDGNYVAATNEYTFNNVNEPHRIEIFTKAVPSPEADFVASVYSGTIPLVVSFTDKSTNLVSSRKWDFGDGHINTLKNPQHTYFEPGAYTVSLHVKGPGGENSKIKQNLINVYDLQIDYNATPASGAYPMTVTFAADMPESVTHVVWSFGDGETSTHISPVHVYREAGEYTTQLTAYAGNKAITIEKKGQINVTGRNISGRITAADTGLGLAGYQVEIIQRQYDHRVGETYTDDKGEYTFDCEPSSENCLTVRNEIPAASDLIVAVWPPAMNNDYYMQYYKNQSLMSRATQISTINGDQDNINLALEKTLPLTIKGKVHDNGVAVSNTQVSASSEKLAFGLNTMTDENGAYTLSGLKASDDYRVYLWDEKHNSEIYYAIPSNATPGEMIPTYSVYNWDAATPVDPMSGLVEHVDIVMDHSINSRGTIQGKLQLDSMEQAENIWVYAFSEELNYGNGAFTDENGYYTITALSEVSAGDPITMGYIVAVHSIQYKSLDDNPSNIWYTYQAYPGVSDKTKAQPVRTDVTGIDFMLVTQCQLTGTVMDIYHTPVPDAEVSVNSEKAGKDILPAITDENGEYAFTGLPPVNDYIVTVTAPSYPITFYKGHSNSSNADLVDLSDGNVGNINFELETGMVIRGIVYIDNVDTTAPEGIWVNIWSKSTQTGGDVHTDTNGQYQIEGLKPHTTDYIISIRIKNYMPAFYSDNNDTDLMNDTVYLSEDASGVAASSLQWAVNRNLILRTGLSISGKILYNGLPLSGIEVEASSDDGWDNDVSKSYLTEGHNYKLSGLPPGEYTVKIKPKNFQDDTYRVDLFNMDVENIIFPIKELESSICGTVYGLASNQHAQIVAWAEGKGYNHTYTYAMVGTGEAIDYTLPVKPSADYLVKFTAGNGYPDQWYDGQAIEDYANVITIAAETISGIDFHVSSGSQVISGTVTFPTTAESGDTVWIDAHSPSTGSNGSTEVILAQDHIANYQIKGLKEAPDFIVVAWGRNYQEQYYNRQSTEDSADLVNTGDTIPDHDINFDMNPGASISGIVYQDGNPATDFYIEAFSESTSSFGGHTYVSYGSYLIEGLDQASDYIIKVYKTGMAPFYYHTSGNTREAKLATKVSTIENKHVTGININTFQLESISGTVRDEEGKALSDIWVNVWSYLKQCGEGIYTAKDGSYQIDGLSKSKDYVVSIDEHADLAYVPEEKSNVKSGSSGVNFILRNAFHLKGTVLDISREPIVKAQIELYSDKLDFDVWTRTDALGTFSIKCIPSANDYVLSVMPYDEDLSETNAISYVKFNEAGLSIDADHTIDFIMEKEIILKQGSFIKGHIYKSDARTPIKDAEISVYSQSNGQSSSCNTKSNSEGFYQLNNIPIGSDYIVTVITNSYAKSSKIDQCTGTTVDFVLHIGGSISGRVIEAEGASLADVLVGIVSDKAFFSASTRTESNGKFSFSGLPRYLENGQDVTDYVLKIYPENYPMQSQGQKKIGEDVTFVCKKGGEITGQITDSLGNPIPEKVIVGIRAFRQITDGGFETSTGAKTDSSFEIDQLLFNTNYQLKVSVDGSNIENDVQWIDSNGQGVSERKDAGVFQAGSHVTIQLNGKWNQ